MMRTPKRGQIWLVNLDPTRGAEIKKTRPALVVSNDISNQYSGTVTILPITEKGKKIYPFEVELSSKTSGLKKVSKIKCQQIRTVDKSRLLKMLGVVEKEVVEKIEEALLIHLAIDV